MLLYHVTTHGRLADIEAHGLRPNRGRAIGGMAYDGHRKGRVFLTSREGVSFWFGKARDFSFDGCENPLEDGGVPVVLRINSRALWLEGLTQEVDPHGAGDAGAPAFFVRGTIPTHRIKVWDGAFWQPVGEVDAGQGVIWTDDEDEEEGGYWRLKGWYAWEDGPSPLIPSEVLP